ncbi:G-type lectin S-receptor-like serine/threonine-protein kinase At1g11330 isoform X2 [Durio zibethinus]|uniref:Receptor-like serine/threonine-protein kinase n=1 Tax=Durio zibethinus TaxID=66656 RepID=A0A6P5YR51_DURZI|nr:G-type lectin S-receptor-like serine/threonine-protein kinase At1g11330 isoform X2 [Durio zibethinus]
MASVGIVRKSSIFGYSSPVSCPWVDALCPPAQEAGFNPPSNNCNLIPKTKPARLQDLHSLEKQRVMEMISGSRLVVLLLLSYYAIKFGSTIDTITTSNSIKDPEAITSNGGVFRLGFFSPANSTDRYVGIWYNFGIPEQSVIWIANRNKPLRDESGIVMIAEDGNLVVSNGQKEILWSSNIKSPPANTSAKVLDSGNLVLQDNTDAASLWESFQQPSNAFVPTMKISTNARTGEKVQLTSWKSSSDPSNGNFSLGLEPLNIPQVFIWNNTRPYWRSGPWNGLIFTGVELMYSFYLDGFNLVNDKEGNFYLMFGSLNTSYSSFFSLNSEGKVIQQIWDEGKRDWNNSRYSPKTECQVYGKCGAFGSCDSKKKSICSCLRGFEPMNTKEWNRGNWTSGCVRSKPLQCDRIISGSESTKDGFLKVKMMKVPDFAEWSPSSEDKCEERCLNNCSCVAYAYDAGIGCMTWSENLIDMQQMSRGGIDLYIRLEHSELDMKKYRNPIIILMTVVIGFITIAISTFFLCRWIAKHRVKSEEMPLSIKGKACTKFSSDNKLQQLPPFKFEELATATTNFSPSNKLGQGGFGPVYKGTLKDGQEIAVKRLSRDSGQGSEEFMNEMLVISKLQHRNLVRLLGCCIEGDEKMLVYEHMPNRSLDAFLFNPAKQKLLDWKKRFNIIEGISRGLLYLHKDSRLRIIHRDIKASNILLDEEMNPKISDFGMARIFGGNENQANTRRVVGTYGYMSPEYAMQGHYSEKSDVFSYGVLLLEIINGRRNTSFYNHEHSSSLLGYAWQLWNEDNILALTDTAVYDQCHYQEIKRCIHVGLLCVQEYAKDRPTISAVISMLNSEIVDLSTPKQPAFTERNIAVDVESPQNNDNKCSINDVTVTNVEGR